MLGGRLWCDPIQPSGIRRGCNFVPSVVGGLEVRDLGCINYHWLFIWPTIYSYVLSWGGESCCAIFCAFYSSLRLLPMITNERQGNKSKTMDHHFWVSVVFLGRTLNVTCSLAPCMGGKNNPILFGTATTWECLTLHRLLKHSLELAFLLSFQLVQMLSSMCLKSACFLLAACYKCFATSRWLLMKALSITTNVSFWVDSVISINI